MSRSSYNVSPQISTCVISRPPYRVFIIMRKKDVLHTVSLKLHRWLWNAFNVSYIYIRSRIMYVVPMKRGWKDDSNHTKNSKSTQKCTWVFLISIYLRHCRVLNWLLLAVVLVSYQCIYLDMLVNDVSYLYRSYL